MRKEEQRLQRLYDAPRTDRAAVWRLTADLALLYWKYIVEFEAKERWLVRLRPWLKQLGRRMFCDYYADLCHAPCVYVIVSQLTGVFYLGETCDFHRRFTEHIYHATSWRRDTQQVHRFLQHFGAHKFVMLPLVGPLGCEHNRTFIERKLIRILQPALNVEHTPVDRQLAAGGMFVSAPALIKRRGCRPLMRQRPVGDGQFVPAHTRERYVAYSLLEGMPDAVFPSLNMLFDAALASRLRHFVVGVSPGMVTLNNRDVLRLQYGCSKVSVCDPRSHIVIATGTLKCCLRAVAPPILRGLVVVVHKLVSSPSIDDGIALFLKEWARDPGMIRALYHVDGTALLRLYRATARLVAKPLRGQFKQRIACVFNQRFGFQLHHKPVLTLPYLGPYCAQYVRMARVLLQQVLHDALHFMPAAFRHWFVAGARVVVRRGVNVSDLFVNYRHFAAFFDPDKPFPCTCSQFPGLARQKHHVCCRADNGKWPVETVPSIDIHSKFVPAQTAVLTVYCLLRQLANVCGQFSKLVYAGAVCTALAQAIPIAKRMQLHAEDDRSPAQQRLEHFESAQQRLQNLVCLQLDRNLHCLVFQCPRLFWSNMMDLYIRDPNYRRVYFTEQQWLQALRLEWREHGWDKIAGLYQHGRASHAYYLPKNKDVLKNRPITPCVHHPLRNLYSISSRGLSFVLDCAEFDHFNLPATTGFKAWMVKANLLLQDHQCDNPSVVGHDVKEMYTKLQHGRIVDALMWVVEKVEQQQGRRVLSVRRRGRRGVQWGRAADSRACASVTLQQLVEIARFELENTFIKVGCVFMWQQVGLAMGGFNSPPLAVITCAVDEYHWLRSLGADARLVCGMRYMDDSTLVCAADGATAQRIVDSYRRDCYQGGLILECTGECSQGELEILECMVKVEHGRLFMRHRNRNAAAIETLHKCHGFLPFKKIVPYTTAAPPSVLCNNAVGLLHRIEMNTSSGDWLTVVQTLLQSKHEFSFMGYPPLFLLKCLKRALPSLLAKDHRWALASAVFSYCVGARWRPWMSVDPG